MNGQCKHRTWPVLLSVWATFFLFAAAAQRVPGVNEPHYLCKARHFWQPDWCSNDFFLASPNAHTVFYATVGGLTSVLPFNESAWIGRILATLILAWGWTKCLSRLLYHRWAPLWIAWVFLAFEACGNFSGEWLVGGVEAKVFSYGFLFAAFGDALIKCWPTAAVWFGLAISFHPLIGIWGLMAFAGSGLVQQVVQFWRLRRSHEADDQRPIAPSLPKDFTACVSWGTVTILLSLPGMIPVIRLLMEPVTDEIRYEANYLQVYFRLAHHLDPMVFPARAYFGYSIFLVIWVCSFWWGGRTNAKRAFDGIVLGAVLFAFAGILIGYGPRPADLMPFFDVRMNLLKFYPFRLGDVLLPMGVAVSLICVLERTLLNVPSTPTRLSRIAVPHVLMLLVFVAAVWRASMTIETNRYANEDRADWLDVCQWIDAHLPANALVQSPTNGWAFKWFAKRAEYVAFKDCPQDAAGIVEWNRRLNFLNQWYEQKYSDNLYSAAELRDLRRKTNLTHLLTDRLGPLELDPIYRNTTFQVYDLRALDE